MMNIKKILWLLLIIAACYQLSCKASKLQHQHTKDSTTSNPPDFEHVYPPPPPPAPHPIADADGDGVNDVEDKCPNVYGTAKYHGCPIPDTDGDGVNDEEDKCPFTAGVAENQGCPLDYDSAIRDIPTGAGVYPDNNAASKEIQQQPKASLAYSYKNKMTAGATTLIQLLVKLNTPQNEVARALRNSLAEQRASELYRTDTSVIKSLTIKADKYFEVAINYDTAIFSVETVFGPSKQELDATDGNKWAWRVRAKKAAPVSDIVIVVKGIDENGISHAGDYTSLPIAISINEPVPNPSSKNNTQNNTNTITNKTSSFLTYAIAIASLLLALTGAFVFWKRRKNASDPKREIYFSYAWNEAYENLVNQLYTSLKNDGFNIKRDKTDLRYRGTISKFMTTIGNAEFVIVILSDKYLRSHFCMFELYEVYRNSRLDKDIFISKLFPLRIENLDLSDEQVIQGYINYWEEEQQRWETLIRAGDNTNLSELVKQYEIVKKIRNEIANLMFYLSDINALNADQLSRNDFAEIRSALKQAMEKRFDGS